MTTLQQEHQQTGTGYARALTIAVLAVVIGVARLFLSAGGGNQTWSDVVVVTVFGVVGLALGFGAVLPPALRSAPSTAAWASVALGVISILAGAVFFFSPAPFVLGYATWFLARTPLARSADGSRVTVAQVLGALAMVIPVVWAVYGTIHGWNPDLPSS
jgi:uncharacterized membrane protein HdeD (DUF308 family)